MLPAKAILTYKKPQSPRHSNTPAIDSYTEIDVQGGLVVSPNISPVSLVTIV